MLFNYRSAWLRGIYAATPAATGGWAVWFASVSYGWPQVVSWCAVRRLARRANRGFDRVKELG
ncbi:hypothetical protein GCM10022233_47070 [Streptomyces shaanxiensis]|uniref:Uncharacterized protein n=1 Tax=Streptomyces shaanxiensis TaxID=653357 RepID=A0ABP7VGB1_9ACTN